MQPNPELTNALRLANGQFQLTILGIAGQTYATEVSSNVANWSGISTNVAPAGIFNITDFTFTNILLRFYQER